MSEDWLTQCQSHRQVHVFLYNQEQSERCVYIFSSRHVQNTFCAKDIHIKHISSFHIPGRVSYGIRTGWLTNEILFFFSEKYFYSNYSFLFHQARREYRLKKKILSSYRSYNVCMLYNIELDETKTKISSYFPLHPFYYFVKIFPIYKRKVVVFVLHEQSKSIKLYVQQYWLGLLLSETRPLMNIDNGEGCLNALWYETGAVVEDCDGIWRVNVLLGW